MLTKIKAKVKFCTNHSDNINYKKKIGQILCPRLIFEFPYFKRKKKVSNMFTRVTKCKRSYYHVSKRKCRA